MEEFLGEGKSVHTLRLYPSAFGEPSSRSSSFPRSDSLSSLSPESLSFPDTSCCANTQIGFGCHFTNSYYCKPFPSTVFQQRVINHQEVYQKATGRSDEKLNVLGSSRAETHGGDPPARIHELGMYQSYTPPYSRTPFDVPVHQAITSDSTHGRSFTDLSQSWNWPISRMYCSKEQTQIQQIWKSSLTGKFSSTLFFFSLILLV